MPSFSVRFEEQQLLDLAAKARVHGCRKGYLHKSDPKLKRLTQRWCCIYANFFFYFESESVPKPLGIVLLEECNCRPVDQVGQAINEVRFYLGAEAAELVCSYPEDLESFCLWCLVLFPIPHGCMLHGWTQC